MLDPDLCVEDRIDAMIDAEIMPLLTGNDVIQQRTAQAFERARRFPRKIAVNFSGGLRQMCWAITRGDGTYRVVYMPSAGYFSLCVESDFGPLDIGVHGPALACFASV